MFFASGTGTHKDRLGSFELALKDAGIEKFNLVYVSSIFPPGCELVAKEEGLGELKPGQIVFCVMAKNQTNNEEFISSAVGMAKKREENSFGYLVNRASTAGEEECAKEAEQFASKMLAGKLGLDESLQEGGFETQSVSCSGQGMKKVWLTVLSAAVFVD